MKKLLARLSIQQLESALSAKKRLARVEPLKQKLAKLQKAAEKIQAKIDRLLGKKSAGRRGRPRKARRGRPPMKRGRKPGRPAKKARKMSAAARKRVALAVSRAQKRRWAAFRKAKARRPVKVSRKRAMKAKAAAPKPGTLEAKIVKVAGEGAGQG